MVSYDFLNEVLVNDNSDSTIFGSFLFHFDLPGRILHVHLPRQRSLKPIQDGQRLFYFFERLEFLTSIDIS